MNRRFRLFIIILLGVACATACKKNVTPGTPESPSPEDEYIAAPSAITPTAPRVTHEPTETPQTRDAAPSAIFIEAERHFATGNYRRAAAAYEKFLHAFPRTPERDRALFHFGLSLALSGDDRDMLNTEIALRRLIDEFPQSPYLSSAELIIDLKTRIERLQSEVKDLDERIRQLSDELNTLKSIDLYRRPSRPE